MSENAIIGEQIWQDKNCTSCHQIYGLGGYLGPDLTNVYSKHKEGVVGFFTAGVGAMPVYSFSIQETEALLSFFKHIDQTGYYPNKNALFHNDGWVEIEYK